MWAVSVPNLSILGGSLMDCFLRGGRWLHYCPGSWIFKLQLPCIHWLLQDIVAYSWTLLKCYHLEQPMGVDCQWECLGEETRALWEALHGFRFVSSFLLAVQQGTLHITATATNKMSKNDMEVPCRDAWIRECIFGADDCCCCTLVPGGVGDYTNESSAVIWPNREQRL